MIYRQKNVLFVERIFIRSSKKIKNIQIVKFRISMKNLLTTLGPILMLIGVAILAVYFFTASHNNSFLIAAGVLEIVGVFVFTLTNKFLK